MAKDRQGLSVSLHWDLGYSQQCVHCIPSVEVTDQLMISPSSVHLSGRAQLLTQEWTFAVLL